MKLKAILFGSIGTLIETSEIQRRAFNQAFSEAKLGWDWDVEAYREMLTKSGGLERIQDFANQCGTLVDVNQLHQRKTEIFNTFMNEKSIPLRSGVSNLISSAKDHGLKLGFVTATSEANVNAVFRTLSDNIVRSDFNFISNGSMITKPKPSPDIYQKALTMLCLDPQECIAIEDTAISMKAALAANIRCIAFPGEFAQENDFNGAQSITKKLTPDILHSNEG